MKVAISILGILTIVLLLSVVFLIIYLSRSTKKLVKTMDDEAKKIISEMDERELEQRRIFENVEVENEKGVPQ